MVKMKGFTLIEAMVASAVLVIFFGAVFVIVREALGLFAESEQRSTATRLLHTRLEYVRNLPYASVGTIGGIPNGSLVSSEKVTVNQTEYTVTTFVSYIDDSFDGVAPSDLLPTDYKRVRVSVSWKGMSRPTSAPVLFADVAPKGLETSAGGGVISILVFDSLGNPVSNANVTIKATTITPNIDINTYTDLYGRIILPGAPICNSCYQITATKIGMTIDRTYGTNEVLTPNKPHVTVLESQVSSVSFSIDNVSSLILKAVRSKANNYAPFSGVQMLIVGTKEIGRDINDDPVYKVNKTATTSSGGTVTVSGLEWDSYSVSVPPTSSVTVAGTYPTSPISLTAGASANFTMVVEPTSTNSLLVTMKNMQNELLNNTSAMISKPGFVATASGGDPNTGDWSQAYFGELEAGIYDLIASAAGYQTATDSVSILGKTLETYQLASQSGN